MERFLIEYLVNSIWQVPLLAAGAWLILRTVRPGPLVQHWVWVSVLPLMLAMPLLTLRGAVAIQPVPAPVPAAGAVSGDISDTLAAAALMRIEAPPPGDLAAPAFEQVTPIRNSSQPRATWLSMREMKLDSSTTHWLVGLYLAIMAFMAMRLLCNCWVARRIVARARPASLTSSESALLAQCCERLGVSRPEVLISPRTSSPMVVGVCQPSLLLPEDFGARLETLAGRSQRELEAVWLHELAHLRRRDYLANLACRIIALPVAYHPATSAVQQRIRQTREMVCDSLAAREMQSPLGYARCLVGLARTMQDGPGIRAQMQGVAMFDGGILEERIMHLIGTKSTVNMRMRALRLVAGAGMLLAVVAAPAILHVTPTMAQQASPALPEAITGTAAPSPTPTPEAAAQPESQTHEAAPAKPSAPNQSAAERAEARRSIAAAKAKAAGSSPEARRQMDDARKQLDHAAKTWADVAAKSAKSDAPGKVTDKQIEDAQRQLSDATRTWNNLIAKTVDSDLRQREVEINNAELKQRMADLQARFNSPEFKKQMRDAQAKFNSPEFKKQMEDAQAKFNNPEFKKKMEDLQAKFNSPEFKKQMQDAQAKFNTPEFKKQIQDAQAKFNSPEFKKQMEDAQAKFNNPEFKKKMEDMQAKFNSPEFRKQMEDARANSDNPELRRQLEIMDNEVREQMEQVQKQISEALKAWDTQAATANVPKQ